jgi:hypothetical protein
MWKSHESKQSQKTCADRDHPERCLVAVAPPELLAVDVMI